MLDLNEDQLYTVTEAANLLGVTSRTVYKYLNTGLLRKRKVKTRTYIPKEDVKDLKVDLLAPTERVSWAELKKFQLEMNTKLDSMERAVSSALHFLGFNKSPLDKVTDHKLRGWYSEVHDVLAHGVSSLTTKEIATWVDILAKLDEEALHRLAILEMFRDVWVPFWELVRDLHYYVTSLPDYNKDHTLRDLGWSLSQSRAMIKGLALIIMTAEHSTSKQKKMKAKLSLHGVCSSSTTEYVYSRLV